MSAGFPPMPLGLSNDNPQRQGLAPTAGGCSPGPVSADRHQGHATHLRGLAGAAAAALRDFRRIELTVGSDLYRLRRKGVTWSADTREEPVGREEAHAVLAQAARLHGDNPAVLAIIQEAAAQLNGFRRDNTFVVLRLRQWESSGGGAVQSIASTPAPTRARPEPAPAPVVVEREIMSEAIARAQAAALTRAAVDGVPFCEECARAAAERAPAALAQPA
jgi:hypothetical protein